MRWLEGIEGEDLTLERAYIERLDDADCQCEDHELAELDATMRRNGVQSGP